MSIEIQTTVVLAEVEMTNEYQVELRQHRRAATYTPAEAVRLGAELTAAGRSAEARLASDLATYAHAFDLAPVCPDCRDGKHNACIGSAWIERGIGIDEVECGCSKAGHPTTATAVKP